MKKKTKRNPKNQERFIALVDEYGEISRKQLEKELKLSGNAVKHIAHAVRQRKINPRQIESFLKKHPKRVYRNVNDVRTTARKLDPVFVNRFNNGLTHIENGMRDGDALKKIAPKRFVALFIEHQKKLIEAVVVR